MPLKLRCRVCEIIDHGEHVYSLLLEPESLAPRFLPGQFLHLSLDEYNSGDFWPDSRPFSIASSPDNRHLLRITYAVKGRFTQRMEAELKPGLEIWVKMPYGEFTVKPSGDICLLAGGTGVTAFTSFLNCLPVDFPHQVFLFYGARIPELLIYRSMLLADAQRCPNLHILFFVEQFADGVELLAGRIDTDKVVKSIINPLDVTYYLAGPPDMLTTISRELLNRNIPASLVNVDAWQ